MADLAKAACGMEPQPTPPPDWTRAQYLTAKSRAGGVAAAIGWNRADDFAVLHSLAVAPTSRGGGIGAGMLASAMAQIMEDAPVAATYLIAPSSRARQLFERLVAAYGCSVKSKTPEPS